MKKKYQVFISSTYTDLQEERAAVTQALLESDCIPVGMEQFPASNMNQMDYIHMMLDDCDYYILILAGRYGSCDTDGIGFTKKEYDYAISKGIPVMSFLVENVDNLPARDCEKTDAGRKKLEDFRKKVSAGKLIKYYTDVNSLKSAVISSIHRCIQDSPAVGWVRGNNTLNDTLQVRDISTFEATVQLFSTTKVYANEANFGRFTFDYSDNNGEFAIGKGEYTFITRWSKASKKSIYAYNDKVDAIARIKGPIELQSHLSGEFNFTSRTRCANIGDIILWRNRNGKYAATRIIDIKDDSRGDDHDELTCEYTIYN